ncbi:MAG: hypothetical protein MHM6MM_008490 [Cercozoa sp. M6MM]
MRASSHARRRLAVQVGATCAAMLRRADVELVDASAKALRDMGVRLSKFSSLDDALRRVLNTNGTNAGQIVLDMHGGRPLGNWPHGMQSKTADGVRGLADAFRSRLQLLALLVADARQHVRESLRRQMRARSRNGSTPRLNKGPVHLDSPVSPRSPRSEESLTVRMLTKPSDETSAADCTARSFDDRLLRLRQGRRPVECTLCWHEVPMRRKMPHLHLVFCKLASERSQKRLRLGWHPLASGDSKNNNSSDKNSSKNDKNNNANKTSGDTSRPLQRMRKAIRRGEFNEARLKEQYGTEAEPLATRAEWRQWRLHEVLRTMLGVLGDDERLLRRHFDLLRDRMLRTQRRMLQRVGELLHDLCGPTTPEEDDEVAQQLDLPQRSSAPSFWQSGAREQYKSKVMALLVDADRYLMRRDMLQLRRAESDGSGSKDTDVPQQCEEHVLSRSSWVDPKVLLDMLVLELGNAWEEADSTEKATDPLEEATLAALNGVSAKDFAVTRSIAQGTDGLVVEAQHLSSGEAMAIKVVDTHVCRPGGVFTPKDVMRLMQERNIMLRAASPFIVPMRWSFMAQFRSPRTGQREDSYLCSVMELASHGDLADLIRYRSQVLHERNAYDAPGTVVDAVDAVNEQPGTLYHCL